MALDPNIILGSKQIDQPNPLDMMTKALTMKELAQKSQMQDRDIAAQNAVRDAYRNNTVTNPDGSTGLNMKAVINQVMQTNPQAGVQLQQQDRANQLAQQQAQMKTYSDQTALRRQLLARVPTDPNISPDVKQAAWTQMLADSAKLGLPSSSQLPEQHPGDRAVRALDDTLQTAEEKLAQHNKEIEHQTERAKANASLAEAGLPTLPAIGTPAAARGGAPIPSGGPAPAGSPQPGGGSAQPAVGQSAPTGFTPPPKMQQKAMEDYTQAVNGSRQEPDALRALNNIASAKTLTEISKLAPGGDLNKLNPQQTKTAIAELVKMVTGGVPSDTELKEMSPDNLAQKYAGVIQSITNKSQPANAGEFLQQGLDYAKGIQGISAKTIKDRANDIADLHGKFMGPEGYQKVKGKIAEEFKRNSPEAPAHPQDDQAVAWAKANPKDPRSAQILQLNGGGQ